jgi:chromosome segregation ATPase
MSEVPLLDAKTSLKKIVSTIVNISGVNSDYIPKLRAQPELVLEAIENYEKEKNKLIKQIEENYEEINNLKNKISQTQRDIGNFEEDNKLLSEKRQKLLNEIDENHKAIESTNLAIKSKREEFENRNKRLKELENVLMELSRENEIFSSKLKDLEDELEKTFLKKERYVQSYENRVAAMKILINKKYLNSSLLQLIKTLQVGSTLDLKNILVAIDMREDKAKRFIAKMLEENGPIIYDEQSETIKLKEEVDF